MGGWKKGRKERKREERRERGRKEKESKVQGYGQLHSKFEAGLGWPESQKTKRKRKKGKSQKIPRHTSLFCYRLDFVWYIIVSNEPVLMTLLLTKVHSVLCK